MTVYMQALKNTSGPDGNLNKGQFFEAKNEERAAFLENGKYAVRAERPAPEPVPAAPVAVQVQTRPVPAVAVPAVAPTTPAK